MTMIHPTPTDDWVGAAPFRAHLRHVGEASGQPWQVLALLAGVSLSLADHLLHGRRGRPVRRITRASAARILSLTSEGARSLPTEWVPADRVHRLLEWLSARGWSPAEIAAAAGVDARVLSASTRHVPHEVELRVMVLVASLDRAAARGAA